MLLLAIVVWVEVHYTPTTPEKKKGPTVRPTPVFSPHSGLLSFHLAHASEELSILILSHPIHMFPLVCSPVEA